MRVIAIHPWKLKLAITAVRLQYNHECVVVMILLIIYDSTVSCKSYTVTESVVADIEPRIVIGNGALIISKLIRE